MPTPKRSKEEILWETNDTGWIKLGDDVWMVQRTPYKEIPVCVVNWAEELGVEK